MAQIRAHHRRCGRRVGSAMKRRESGDSAHAVGSGNRRVRVGIRCPVRAGRAGRALSRPRGAVDRCGRPGRQPGRSGAIAGAEAHRGALGKPFVVENMPGAGGVVAANLVAKARARRPCADARRFRRARDQRSRSIRTSPTIRSRTSRRSRRWRPCPRFSWSIRRCRRKTLAEFIALAKIEARSDELRLGRSRLDPSPHDGDLRRARRHRARSTCRIAAGRPW